MQVACVTACTAQVVSRKAGGCLAEGQTDSCPSLSRGPHFTSSHFKSALKQGAAPLLPDFILFGTFSTSTTNTYRSLPC